MENSEKKTTDEVKVSSNTSKRLLWIVIVIAGLAITVIFLTAAAFYKPFGSEPGRIEDTNVVSSYLTGDIGPAFYNGIQREVPFEIELSQVGVNDILSHQKWPLDYDEFSFFLPRVYFANEGVVLMDTFEYVGVEAALTAVFDLCFDSEGLLHLNLKLVRLGAVNVTTVAKIMAKRYFENWLSDNKIGQEDIRAKVGRAILDGEGIRPVIDLNSRRIRISKVETEIRRMKIGFSSAED